MTYASVADRDALTAEMPWEERYAEKTMWGLLSRTAAAHGDRPAVTFQMFSGPDDPAVTLSWTDLRAEVARTANMLRRLGIGENDVVAYVLPNCVEVVVAYLAGQVAGIVNPINPLLEPEQIGALLRETQAKAVITLKSFPKTDVAQKTAAAVALAPNVNHVIEVDLLRYITGIKRLIVPLIRPRHRPEHGARVLDFAAEVAKEPVELQFPDSEGDRVAALFHTGGTTGMPKLAQHWYSGILYNAWLGDKLLFTPEDVQITPLPMFHVFAATVSLGAALGSGCQVVFPTPQGYRGDGVFDNFWKLVERHKVTFMIGVPTAFAALMQRPVNADISTLKLAFSGSAPLPLELFRRFETAAGVNICEGYGLTEATCLVSVNPPDGEKKVGSVGIPFPYTDVKIIDVAGGAECPEETVGEICVFSPGVSQGHTYVEERRNADLYRQPEGSNALYLRTGDLGRIDEDGYLWITGRAKDLIIRGGHNIDPAEIEEALMAHEAVAFVGAIGQPDSYAGELPCAYVELVDGGTVEVAELIEFAKARIHERAAHPKHVEILPELPKTAVGKIFKPALRRLAVERVYNGALADADCPARVTEVVEDKKRGLVARVALNGASQDEVAAVLSSFTRPWDVAD